MRTPVLVGIALVTAAAWACSSSTTPVSPTPTTSGGGGGAAGAPSIIFVEGGGGGESFSPNPASVTAGSPVIWMNSDEQTHQIVATDGSFDTGVLGPDAQSAPIVLTTDGAHYYCAIHPSELGAIKSANGTVPPCSGPHC
jgi:plastocyanin